MYAAMVRTGRARVIEIGDFVWWRGRRCHLRGVGPASLPERLVELEELDTGKRYSAAFTELESDVVRRIGSYVGPSTAEYPQQRVSNLGRKIAVDRVDGKPDQFVFTQSGQVLAELHPPPTCRPEQRGDLLGWRLTFPNHPERILAAPPGEPPISGALFFIDIALRAVRSAVSRGQDAGPVLRPAP